MILPLDREAIPKQQQKDFTWDIQRGNLGTAVKWFGISFANNYLGIEFAESLASLLSHGRQYLSVSDRRYSSCGQDGSSVCI